MAIIKSSSDHIVINADGASKDIKFQANGVEKASISSAGAFTSTTIDATKLTGNLPAISGASLTSLTSGNLTGALPAISGASLTNLPAGGITDADQWRLTTSATGNIELISNLERVDTAGFGKLGTGMTESSGVFTFPSTGIWHIGYNVTLGINGDSRQNYAWIKTTTNNSTWVNASESNNFIQQTQANVTYSSSYCDFLFDVTDTTTHKVKFASYKVNTSVSTSGNSTLNNTSFTFIRLGDT